jgi:hypothetical protein
MEQLSGCTVTRRQNIRSLFPWLRANSYGPSFGMFLLRFSVRKSAEEGVVHGSSQFLQVRGGNGSRWLYSPTIPFFQSSPRQSKPALWCLVAALTPRVPSSNPRSLRCTVWHMRSQPSLRVLQLTAANLNPAMVHFHYQHRLRQLQWGNRNCGCGWGGGGLSIAPLQYHPRPHNKHCPSARCACAANAVGTDLGAVSFNHIL